MGLVPLTERLVVAAMVVDGAVVVGRRLIHRLGIGAGVRPRWRPAIALSLGSGRSKSVASDMGGPRPEELVPAARSPLVAGEGGRVRVVTGRGHHQCLVGRWAQPRHGIGHRPWRGWDRPRWR